MSGGSPSASPNAWIAESATVLGPVTIADRASIWFGAVVRSESEPIAVGPGTNIQDGCVVHTDPGFEVWIGTGVTVGHRAVLHGCVVEDDCLIGIGAVVLNGARVGRESLVAAGAVVGSGVDIPPRSLVTGLPARVVRHLSDDEVASLKDNASTYLSLAAEYAGRRTGNTADPADPGRMR